jgi:cell division protein FtsB
VVAAADPKAAPKVGAKAVTGATATGARAKAATDDTPSGRPPLSAVTRRNRIPVAVAALCALVVLVAGFPAAGLLSQHHQQAAASAQLAQLRLENHRLAEQQRALNSKTEIERLARLNYQLVAPGEALYDVLPPAGKGRSATAPGGVEADDPGNQPLVSPSNAPDMSPDPGLPVASSPPPTSSSSSGTSASGSSPSAHGTGTGSSSSFWGRVADTLEFWQ